MQPSISVVVTTYRSPGTLVLVMTALARQSVAPDEVVVADDGSSGLTLQSLREFGAEAPFRLLHVWQPDAGFRAARGRNSAIHFSSGDVLAFLDQDTLPHRGWLEAHASHADAGRVCLGDILRMREEDQARLTRHAVAEGAFEQWHSEPEWCGLRRRQRRCALYALLRRMGLGLKSKPRLMSGNFAARRVDLARVNGFDEEYVGWGQEDDDLGRRLYASGVRPVPLVAEAIVTHIPHPPRRPRRWEDGANRFRFQRHDLPARCAAGLDAHPHPDVRLTVVGPRSGPGAGRA